MSNGQRLQTIHRNHPVDWAGGFKGQRKTLDPCEEKRALRGQCHPCQNPFQGTKQGRSWHSKSSGHCSTQGPGRLWNECPSHIHGHLLYGEYARACTIRAVKVIQAHMQQMQDKQMRRYEHALTKERHLCTQMCSNKLMCGRVVDGEAGPVLP